MSLALMALLFVPCLIAAPNDEQVVRQAVSGFAETWNRHDMEAFGRLFAPDADFVNVAGDWWKGRQAIQMHHAYSHGTIPAETQGEPLPYYGIFKTSTLRFSQIDVRFLRKDVSVAHASWELLGDARSPNPRHGLITFVLTRQDGAWLIAAAQNTEINRAVK
jgi:ketosteroid isomerase-like protein